MKKSHPHMKRFLIVLICLFGAYAACTVLPRPQNYAAENTMRRSGDMPILIAHGGGNREFPDNTLEAFYNAYSVDPRVMMETDVCITADGVVILSHDTTLDRKTNVTGSIAEWNYADLMAQRVNFGYTNPTSGGVLNGARRLFAYEGMNRSPLDVNYPEGVTARDEKVFLATTLEELITAFPENRINVEIKQSGETGMRALREVIRLLEKHNAFDRVVLASFHDDVYAEFGRLRHSGEVPETFMYSPSTGGAGVFYALQVLGLDVFYQEPICALQLPTEKYDFSLAEQSLIDTAHAHNIAVHYWTINDPAEMRMLIDLGADGIMTDYPHRLKEVYESYGQ